MGSGHRGEHGQLQLPAQLRGGFAADQAAGHFGHPLRHFVHAVPGTVVVTPSSEFFGESVTSGAGGRQFIAQPAGDRSLQHGDGVPEFPREACCFRRAHAQNSDSGERRDPPRLRSLRRRRRMREWSSLRRLRSHSSRVTGSSFLRPRRISSRTRNSQKSW